MLIAIQSARAYNFKVTDKTKITGKDKKLVVGYMVKVKYNGDIDKEPGATEIEVISVKTAKALEINGTVARAKLGVLILKVGEKKYRFMTGKDTKFTGKKAKRGRAATVTYVGKLG